MDRYIIWSRLPDYCFYIDGCADVYGIAWRKVHAVQDETNWRAPFTFRTVLVKPDVALASLLDQDGA